MLSVPAIITVCKRPFLSDDCLKEAVFLWSFKEFCWTGNTDRLAICHKQSQGRGGRQKQLPILPVRRDLSFIVRGGASHENDGRVSPIAWHGIIMPAQYSVRLIP